MTTKPIPQPDPINSTMASRKAEAEARAAAGEVVPPRRSRGTFRAGLNAENPVLTVTHVQA